MRVVLPRLSAPLVPVHGPFTRFPAPGDYRAPTPAGGRASLETPASSPHACRPGVVGLAFRRRGVPGARPFTSSGRTPSSRDTGGFRLVWKWKSRRRNGRPGVPPDVRALIRELSASNPLWGAPRIHGSCRSWASGQASRLLPSACGDIHVRRHRRGERSCRTRQARSCRRFLRRADHHVPNALRAHHPRARASTDLSTWPSPTTPQKSGRRSSSATPSRTMRRPRISSMIAMRSSQEWQQPSPA